MNREKVENAIKILRYRPNLIARSLKTKQTGKILFYVPNLLNPFHVEVYEGMEDYTEENDLSIVVSCHYTHSMVQQRQFDGVILSYLSSGSQDEIKKLGISVIHL